VDRLIDCDVHNTWRSTDEFKPWLPGVYRDRLERGEVPGFRGGAFPVACRPWLHPENGYRLDAETNDGALPGSSLEQMRAQLIDRFGLEFAILNGDYEIDLGTLADSGYAAALATARNQWLRDTWLDADDRLRGSIMVTPQDPAAAAAEIARCAEDPRFVQVLLPSHSERPYGNPFYAPIVNAAAEAGLPIAIHFGGTAGINQQLFACGNPTYYAEYHTLLSEAGMSHVASLIFHGVFERHPNLVVVLLELGFTWLPSLVWRMNADYRALRRETPWVTRLPSEYAWEHLRFTTQPFDQPEDTRDLRAVLEAMHGDELLMFSSDYPHWDFDDPTQIAVPSDWRAAIFHDNAARLYHLDTVSA
jgi:uncharacterized protein